MTQPTTGTLQHQFGADEVIDLRSYFQVIGRFKWRILLFAIVVAVMTAAVLKQTKSIYRSTATMLIEAEEAKAVSIEEIYGLDSSRAEYFQTQFEILKSRRLAERVIQQLSLQEQPEFKPDASPSPLKQAEMLVRQWLGNEKGESAVAESAADDSAQRARIALLNTFMARLSIEPVKKTQLVKISFEAQDPALAALVANTLGEVYINTHLDDKMAMTQHASDWLRDRLETLRINLHDSEKRLQTFREQNRLVDIEGVVALTGRDLNELTTQLGVARQKRADAQSLQQQLNRSDIEQLLSLPEISRHQLIQDIKRQEAEAERQLAELAQRYGPKHSKMIAAQAQLTEIRVNLARRITQLAEGMSTEANAVIATEAELRRELDKTKEKYQQLSRLGADYRVLEREVQANRELYNTFLTRMKETGAVGDFQAVHARITDPAEPAVDPSKPKKKLIVIMAFAAALMLGVILAFLQDALADTLVTPSDVEQQLGLRVIGLIPIFLKRHNKKSAVHAFFDAKAQALTEAWRTLRTGYVLQHIEQPARIVTITSTLPGEGKTTTAINFAFALSQVERVLLIEADMRRPQLASRFGLPNYQPGLANLLNGHNVLADCIYRDEQSGLELMVAGTGAVTPLELLTSPEFGQWLHKLGEIYDRIVIDTPPAQIVSDALVVARSSDSIIYVVRSGMVRRKPVKDTLQRFHAMRTRVDGVVLNGIPARDLRSYLGYDYGSHYSYNQKAQPQTGNAVKPGETTDAHQSVNS